MLGNLFNVPNNRSHYMLGHSLEHLCRSSLILNLIHGFFYCTQKPPKFQQNVDGAGANMEKMGREGDWKRGRLEGGKIEYE